VKPEFSGECDWCRQHSDDLVEHQDWEEGLSCQLLDVCEACRVKEGITIAINETL